MSKGSGYGFVYLFKQSGYNIWNGPTCCTNCSENEISKDRYQLLSIVCPVFFPYQNFHTNTCVHVLSIYAFLLIRFLLQSGICGTYCNLALVLWYNFIQQKDHPHGEFCAGGTIGYKLYSPNWVNMQHFVFIAVKIWRHQNLHPFLFLNGLSRSGWCFLSELVM